MSLCPLIKIILHRWFCPLTMGSALVVVNRCAEFQDELNHLQDLHDTLAAKLNEGAPAPSFTSHDVDERLATIP